MRPESRDNPIGIDGLPERLYKYMPLRNPIEAKRALRFLLRNEAWFGSFETWDDRDEGTLFRFDRGTIRRMMIRGGLRDNGQSLKAPNPSIRCAVERIADRNLSETSEQELQARIHKYAREGSSALCLSDKEDDETLWEAYGASGNGICFELRACGYLYSDSLAIRVKYSASSRPTLNAYSDRPGRLIQQTLATKRPEWSQQSEWRIFVPDQPPGRHVLKGFVVTGIILGHGIDPRLRKLFMRARFKNHARPYLRISRVNQTQVT